MSAQYVVRVHVTAGCPSDRLSVCLSVPSIDSRSDVQLVCCSSGAGGRYRSIAAGAAYLSAIDGYLQLAPELSSRQRHVVT